MKLRYKERMRVGQERTEPVFSWTLYLSENRNKYHIDTFSFHIFTAERFTLIQVETDVPIVPHTCFLTNGECEEWTAHECGRNLDPSEFRVMICYCRYHEKKFLSKNLKSQFSHAEKMPHCLQGNNERTPWVIKKYNGVFTKLLPDYDLIRKYVG